MTVRELHGWSPKTFTLDTEGRVVSVSVTQPRFTPRERALLLASRRAEKARRGQHGRLLSESTDAANQFAYTARGPITDWAQKKLNDVEAAYKKQHPDADMGALHFWVEKPE